MAQLTVQESLNSGLEATFSSAASGGDYFNNNGKTYIEIVNGGGSDITLTVDSPTECSQGETHDIDVVVTAGERRHVGPFDKSRFNDDDGRVNLTYSAVTSVTIAAISL